MHRPAPLSVAERQALHLRYSSISQRIPSHSPMKLLYLAITALLRETLSRHRLHSAEQSKVVHEGFGQASAALTISYLVVSEGPILLLTANSRTWTLSPALT